MQRRDKSMSQNIGSRIRALVARVIRGRISSFALIGLALYLFGAIFIEIAFQRWHWSIDAANFVQAFVSVVMNYLLNYVLTWRDRRKKSFRHRTIRYILAKLVTVPLGQLVFTTAHVGLGTLFKGSSWWLIIGGQIAYFISTGFIMVVNYTLMDRFVFGEGTLKEDALNLITRALFFWK